MCPVEIGPVLTARNVLNTFISLTNATVVCYRQLHGMRGWLHYLDAAPQPGSDRYSGATTRMTNAPDKTVQWTLDATPTPVRSNRSDLRRERDRSQPDLRSGCPMLGSSRDLRRLNPQGKLRVYSKRNLPRYQRVNNRGKVRNIKYYLHGG